MREARMIICQGGITVDAEPEITTVLNSSFEF